MLELNQITKIYISAESGQQLTVLNLPHLSVQAGEKVSLTGPSGSGKSTMLNAIAGIIRPTTGTISILGTEITKLSEQQLDAFRARHVGYVFQNFHLLPGFSALENIVIAMKFAGTMSGSERTKRAKALLERVGLSHRMHNKPHQLSNGEQQRVAIARALANQPAMVLADEPTASLDVENGRNVVSLLTSICSDHGAALLLCTHDPDLVSYTDRRIELQSGVYAPEKEAKAHVAP